MSRTALVIVLVLGLLVSCAPAALAVEPGPPAGAAAKKKPKKKKRKKAVRCKAGQVKETVKVKRRKATTRCLSARKAWPAPKRIDMRAVGASYVLGTNFSKVRDRRGRRAKSLPKLLKRVHPRAERALVRATKAGLARMDSAAGASQAGGCGGEKASFSATYHAGGGQSVEMTATGGPDASLALGLVSQNGNRRAHLEIEFPACEVNQLDECPTAAGRVDGRDNRRISMRAWVTEGPRLVWSQRTTFTGETTFRGETADDAKLEFFEPHNTEVGQLTLGDRGVLGFQQVTIRMLVQRITRVTMRGTPAYQLGPSIINATLGGDIGAADAAAAQRVIEAGMRAKADQQFRDIIAKAIEKFRKAEEHWSTPSSNCATIEFTPASGSMTLHAGDTGSVSANLLAKRGGSPGTATWTHTGASNGTFAPGTAASVPAAFSYDGITQAGEGIFVSGTWRAVSRAGVAEGTWTQPTENRSIDTIAGSFNGHQNIEGTIFDWTGDVTFKRAGPDQAANGVFRVQSASYVVVASGKAGNHACDQSGTKTITDTDGDFASTGQGPSRTPPYDFDGHVIGLGGDGNTMMITLSNCDDPADDGKSVITSMAFTPLRAVGRSPDGVDFGGSHEENQGGTNRWVWTLQGTR